MRSHDSVERLQSLQNAILESIARGEELAAIMTGPCEGGEAVAPGVICSFGPTVVDFRGFRVGILVCEDIWEPEPAQLA